MTKVYIFIWNLSNFLDENGQSPYNLRNSFITLCSMTEPILSKVANQYAQEEYFDYRVYIALCESEKNPEFKKILSELIEQELSDYRFWVKYASDEADDIPPFKIRLFLLIRKIF